MADTGESQANSPVCDPARIVEILSRNRLGKYLHRAQGDATQALALYLWNMEVGAALTVTLSQVEVCLRNRVSEALADAFGPNWHRVAKFRHAHQEVQKELKKSEDRLKPSPSLPDIVAASDFNLWRELCKPGYAGVFWVKRIPIAFPHLRLAGKERDILAEVHRRVDLLLKLRNRIAHHEPIIGSSWEPVGSKLADRHREAKELLEWMSPDVAKWIGGRDRFSEVMTACPL